MAQMMIALLGLHCIEWHSLPAFKLVYSTGVGRREVGVKVVE